MALTEKQKKFVEEYVRDLNATRAYKAAYPNVKKDASARANGSKLLAKTNIQTYKNELLEELQSQRIASAQEVLEHLTAAMRGQIKEEVVVVEGTGDGESSAKIVEKQAAEKDRLRAAELLGRRYSLFTDKVDISGSLETEKTKLDDLIEQMRGDGR